MQKESVTLQVVVLRKNGLPFAELALVDPIGLGKTAQLRYARVGEDSSMLLLEMTVVGDRLLYSSVNNMPMLGDTAVKEVTEHDGSNKE